MSFYSDRVLLYRLSLAMRNKELEAYRRRRVPAAQGRVLEIGIGSGLNLPFYGPGVIEVVGLDPSASVLRMVGERGARLGNPGCDRLVGKPHRQAGALAQAGVIGWCRRLASYGAARPASASLDVAPAKYDAVGSGSA